MDKKDHILEVAEELFAEHGFEGTSTRMLATKAGVNLAMISYYFGSKEKLFEEMVDRKTSGILEKLQMLNESPSDPWTKFETLIDIYTDRILNNHRFHKILGREISLQQRSVISTTLMNRKLRNAQEMRKLIENGIETKAFRPVDIPLTLATLLGTLSQMIQSHKFACMLMGDDPSHCNIDDKAVRTRIKDHLKKLFKAHLLNQ